MDLPSLPATSSLLKKQTQASLGHSGAVPALCDFSLVSRFTWMLHDKTVWLKDLAQGTERIHTIVLGVNASGAQHAVTAEEHCRLTAITLYRALQAAALSA